MSGGFFRGTSADQDTRFSNKQAKLLKSQKFAPELDHLVDMTKVKMDVIKPWIANRVTELLGFEDEVLINFIYGLLDGKDVNGKQVQISLTGFMEKNTGKFMKELWSLLLSAQKNASGVPQQFLDAKEEETRKKKAESDRIANEIQKKKDKESREYEQERLNKMDNGDKQNAGDMELEPPSKNMLSKVSAACPEDERNADQRNGVRRKRVSRSPRSPDCSPSHRGSRSQSVSRSPSKSRSYSDDKRKFRSVSRSPQPRRRSISSDRKYNSQRRRSITPRSRRSRSPAGRRSSFSKRRSPSLLPRRSPSPIRHRVRSPYRRRSPVPVRRRSRSPVPVRRRSRSPVRRHRSPTPIRHHRSSSYRHRRSPSPVRRRRSPSPVPRRSPSRVHRISPSPKHHRSPSHKRRRSPSLKGHRSPPKHNRSSPKRRRSPSPSLRRSSTPKREQSHRSSSTPKHRSLSTPKHRSSSLDRRRSLASSHRSVTASPDESLSRSSLSPLQHRSSSPVRSPKGRRSPLLSPGERQRMQGKLSPVGRRPSAPRSSDSILMDQGDGGDKSPVYKSQSHVRNRSPSEDRRSSSPYENPMKQRRDHITRDYSFSPEHKRRELKGQWDSKGTSRKIDASRSRLSPPVSRKRVSPRKVHIPEGSAGGWSTDSQKQLDNVELRKNDVEMRSEKSSGKGTYDRQRSPAVSEDSFQCEKQTASQQREEKKSDRRGLSSQNNMDSDQYRKAETSPMVLDKVADSNHALDSGSEGSTKQRTKHKEKRKHKRSERHEVTSDDYSSYDSEVEGRKEAKRRRRKEEKKLRKGERRKRREERRRRREERHAEKLKVKVQDNSISDEHETMRISRLDDEEAETEQKKLEIELREKALESLKAKKGLSR